MGQIIDLFTKQIIGADDGDPNAPEFAELVARGSDAVVGTDDEEFFVSMFFEKFLGEFEFCFISLKEASTVEELEDAIKCIQEQVGAWPSQ